MKRTTLIAASLVVIAVLYIASIGPAWLLTKRGQVSKQAFQAVYLPLVAFEDHCPGDLLWRYESWWAPKMDIHLRDMAMLFSVKFLGRQIAHNSTDAICINEI